MNLKKKNKQELLLIGIAIVCLTVLEIVALMNGVNGKIYSIMIITIAGLAGWSMPQFKIGQ
jgi:hypothetical protein